MTRPRRWLDDPDEAPRGARALLDAAGAPDRATRDRVWAALQSGTAPPDAAPPTSGADAAATIGATSAALSGAAGVKKLAALAAFIAFGAIAREGLHRAESPTRTPTASTSPVAAPSHVRGNEPSRAAITAPTPIAPQPAPFIGPTVDVVRRAPRVAQALSGDRGARVVAQPEPASVVTDTAPGPVEAAPPSSVEDSGLDAERELLRAAYERLDADPADALARVTEHERRFPHGHLGHEREVVRVEALHRLGRDGEARARIDAFLQAWSSSTQAPRMRALRERLSPESIR